MECIVCLEAGQAPLYCCQEQHLVCSDCMPGVRETGQCPSCRLRYPGGDLLRHRAAERTAARLGGLRGQLGGLNNKLENTLTEVISEEVQSSAQNPENTFSCELGAISRPVQAMRNLRTIVIDGTNVGYRKKSKVS